MPLTVPQLRHTGQATRATTQAINNATGTSVSFSGTNWDTAGFWSAGQPTRLTVPSGWPTRRARLHGAVQFAANAVGVRLLVLFKNNTSTVVDQTIVPSTVALGLSVSADIMIAADDYFELRVYQTAGGALNVDVAGFAPFFTIDVLY